MLFIFECIHSSAILSTDLAGNVSEQRRADNPGLPGK